MHAISEGKDPSGHFRTTRLQTYPAGLCYRLALKIVLKCCELKHFGTGPGGGHEPQARLTRVSAWGLRATKDGRPEVAILNEEVVAGRHVILHGAQRALYVHVDDGGCYGRWI